MATGPGGGTRAPGRSDLGAEILRPRRKGLREPAEAALHVAYELGREAVSRALSVLDLAVAHHEALATALGASRPGHVLGVVRAAGDFFLESLGSFEMVQRGFREAGEAVLVGRRQTELSRRLPSFLADAALALDSSDSLEEMLRLVAEQARELVGADCCVATVAMEGLPRAAEAATHAEDGRCWSTFVRWLDRAAIYRILHESGGSVRIGGERLAGLELFRDGPDDPPLHGWLAASLTTLDGSELGAVQLFDKPRGDFTRDDEEALVHLPRWRPRPWRGPGSTEIAGRPQRLPGGIGSNAPVRCPRGLDPGFRVPAAVPTLRPARPARHPPPHHPALPAPQQLRRL